MRKTLRTSTPVCVVMLLLAVALAQSASAATKLVHVYSSAHGDDHLKWLEARAVEFEQAHPGVDVELVLGGGNLEKVQLMIAGGTPMDVGDFPLAVAGVLASDGHLRDLTEFIKRDKEFKLTNYPPFTLDALSLPNGSTWGIPTDLIPVPAFYNISFFEDAGLPTPNQLGEGWTWEALVSSARKLNKDTDGDGKLDRWGLGMGGGMAARAAFVVQAGGMYFDSYKNPKESRLNTPQVATALQWYSDLYNVHGVLPLSVYGAATDLPSGKAAIDLASTISRIGMFNDGGIRFDMAPQPKGPANRAPNINQNSLQMFKSTTQPELAWEWMKFISGPENMQKYIEATGRIPAYLPLVQRFNRFIVNPPPSMMKALVDVVMDPTAYHAPIGSKAAKVLDLVNNRILVPARNGKPVPVESTLAELHRQAQAIFAE